MKRLFQLVVALVLLSSAIASFGQVGACYYDRVNDTSGKAVPYPQVQVCSTLASGNPCTPKSTIYSDAALTPSRILPNPLTGDSRGNINFCAAVGVYTVQFLPGTQSTITYSEVSLPVWNIPPAGITNIATSAPLFGGPITTTGTISCPTCEVTTNKDQPNGYAGLSAGSKISGTEQLYGTIANTAAQGNDSRIVNAVQSSRLISATLPLAGGGDLTVDRTLTCLTCVVAAVSPAAGIARFAGGTQTATSAELSGDITTSGSNATTVAKIQGTAVAGTTGTGNVAFSASPTFTGSPLAPTQSANDNSTKLATTQYVDRIGPGGSGAAITFWTPNGTVAGNTTVVAANVVRIAHFFLTNTVAFNTIGVQNVTADAANNYSFGVFSLDGTIRYAHTTAQAMVGTGTFRALAVAEGTVTLPPGDYLFAWTGAATTASFLTLGSGVGTRLAPSSSATATALGVMPAAPINVPALSPNQAAVGIVSFILYQ